MLEGSGADINANWNLVNYRHARASQLVLVVKNLHANAGDARDESSIPRLGRSPGGGHGDLLQYSCLENPMDEESGGLPSMGSHRIRHNWSNLTYMLEQTCQGIQIVQFTWFSVVSHLTKFLSMEASDIKAAFMLFKVWIVLTEKRVCRKSCKQHLLLGDNMYISILKNLESFAMKELL